MLFFTGFPGFLGSELIQQILIRDSNHTILCLVQKKFFSLASEQRRKLPSHLQSKVEFIEGDLTLPLLGMSSEFLEKTAPKIEQIFHLAAVYDLNVSEDLGMKINVGGTKHTLAFAKHCPNLKRFQYVSTCYVSGRYPGTFSENDLVKNQKFNNFYENTKYLAEVAVQDAMKAGLPTTIYRPGVVVGNSKTGVTQKFDGPYFVLQWLLRQPKRFALLPTIFSKDCKTETCTLDLVPSDFVIQGIAHLSQREDTKNLVFQLADPHPLTVPQIIQEFEKVLNQKIISIPTPLWLARLALRYIPGLQKWMGIPYSSLNYFVHPTHYDVSNTLKYLQGSGIEIPRFNTYLPKLVSFMKQHRNIRAKALT